MKKNSLFPHEYDEISLVDSGANQDAHVLIFKAAVLPGGESVSTTTRKKKKTKKTSSTSSSKPRVSSSPKPSAPSPSKPKAKKKKSGGKKPSTLSSVASAAQSLYGGKKKLRSQSNPCSTATNNTGAKETSPKKQSPRAKNWQEGKHPRNAKGQMTFTSQKSKQQNGKGGTTKAKLDAKCKRKGVKKSEMSNWQTDALVRSIMERKAIS